MNEMFETPSCVFKNAQEKQKYIHTLIDKYIITKNTVDGIEIVIT